jgi:hypothetical protein
VKPKVIAKRRVQLKKGSFTQSSRVAVPQRRFASRAQKQKDKRVLACGGQASLRSEDATKLPKSDFFVPKLPVFSITFGRKTKKSQPLRMTT